MEPIDLSTLLSGFVGQQEETAANRFAEERRSCPSPVRFALSNAHPWTPAEMKHIDACPFCRQTRSAAAEAGDPHAIGAAVLGAPPLGFRALEHLASATDASLTLSRAPVPPFIGTNDKEVSGTYGSKDEDRPNEATITDLLKNLWHMRFLGPAVAIAATAAFIGVALTWQSQHKGTVRPDGKSDRVASAPQQPKPKRADTHSRPSVEPDAKSRTTQASGNSNQNKTQTKATRVVFAFMITPTVRSESGGNSLRIPTGADILELRIPNESSMGSTMTVEGTLINVDQPEQVIASRAVIISGKIIRLQFTASSLRPADYVLTLRVKQSPTGNQVDTSSRQMGTYSISVRE